VVCSIEDGDITILIGCINPSSKFIDKGGLSRVETGSMIDLCKFFIVFDIDFNTIKIVFHSSDIEESVVVFINEHREILLAVLLEIFS
jgi:hypothetical protein